MRSFLIFLLDYGSYFLILIIVATWKLWAPKVIAHNFDKELAKYKTDLETEKEKQLAEYGKSITSFNKFFDKKYEVYPIMYSKVIRLHSEFSRWAPMQTVPDFNELIMEEFIEYIDTFRFSKPDRRVLINKKESGDICSKDLFDLLPMHFQHCIADPNNYYLENRLFLSVDIDSLVEKFLKNAHEIRSGYGHVFSSRQNRGQWDMIETTNKENEKVIEDLLRQLKSELEHGVPSNE